MNDFSAERILWINDKTVGGGAGKLYRTAVAVLGSRGAVVAPFFGLSLPGEVPEEFVDLQPARLSDGDYAGFLRRSLGDAKLIAQLRRMRAHFSPTVVVVQNCHKYIGPDVIIEVQSWGIPVVLLVNDYGIYCANCYGWRAGAICHACIDHRFVRAVWKGCALRPGFVSKAMSATRTLSLALAWRKDAYFKAHAVLTAGAIFRERLVAAGFAAERVHAGIFPHVVTGRPVEWSPPAADGVPRFVYYGSDLLVKGQGLLLESIRHIRQRCRVELYVLKPSPELRAMVTLAAGANPAVELLLDAESKWESGVREAVLASRAVLVPSVWESPHELVVYESMALGRPVITTSCSSNSELIQDGVDGYVVSAADPAELAARIDVLAQDHAGASEMGRRAALRYEEHMRPERWAEDFWAVMGIARKHSGL